MGAMEQAAFRDHQELIASEMSSSESATGAVRQVLTACAGRRGDWLDLEDLHACVGTPEFQRFLRWLRIDMQEVSGMFRLLDRGGARAVHVDELLLSCLRLRGPSCAVDVCTLLSEHKRLMEAWRPAIIGINELLTRSAQSISQAQKGDPIDLQ